MKVFNHMFYSSPTTMAILLLIGSLAVGIGLGISVGIIIGRRMQQRDEPRLWQLLRHYQNEAEQMAIKLGHEQSIIKSIKTCLSMEDALK